jgi:GT2 family glycosyltransferase
LKERNKLKTLDNGSNEWPFVSIIIVNLNGKKWLEKCFKSVLASDYPHDKFEIILVDNGSTDGSVKFVKDLFRNDTRIKVLCNERNLGWSPANNQGMKLAKGEILICLSNDMEVDPRWLKEIVNMMRSDSSIGIVPCNSISMWDRKTFDSGMNFLDKYGFAYSYAPQEKPRQVFFAEGMAFAIRKHVFEEIGGFDDYYFMEYDDMDLSWRARLAGYKVFFCPTSLVYHARGGTVGGTYLLGISGT